MSEVAEPLTVTAEQAIEVLKSTGYVVRTADEDNNFVMTTAEEKARKLADDKISERWRTKNEEFEAEIKQLTGIEKQAGENAQAYLKRAIPELKSKDAATIEREYKAQLEAVRGQIGEKDNEIRKIREEYTRSNVRMQIENEIAGRVIATPSHLTSDEQKAAYIAAQRNLIVNQALSTYKYEMADGNLIFKVGDEVQRSKQDGKPLPISELIDRDFGLQFAPKETVKTGTGTGSTGNSTPTFANDSEVISYLKGKGLAVGSAAYMEAFIQLTKKPK